MDLNKVEHGNDKNMYHNSKTIGSYGYTVSYKYSNDGTKVNYTSENGSKMTIDANMFYHYDDTTKSFIRNSNADKTKTYTLTNNLNEYYPINIYKVGNGELNNKGYRWYELLYRNTTGGETTSTNQKYYVATRRDYANPSGYNSYGIFVSAAQGFLGETLTKTSKDSNGNVNISESSKAYGIRVVVTLSENASLVKSSSMSSNNINYNVFNITKKGVYANGQEVYFNVDNGTKCTSSDYTETQSNTGTKSGCMKFYAFNDDGGDTVNLILDHNTTARVAWNNTYTNDSGSKISAKGPKEVLDQLKTDTASWKGTITPSNYTMDQSTQSSKAKYTIDYSSYKARLITAQEIATITGNTTWNEKSADTYYYFDSKTISTSDTCKEGNTSGCSYGWLYDRTHTSCTTYGCLNNADSLMTGYGYWTASSRAANSSDAWRVFCYGSFRYNAVYDSSLFGVRPVITILKSQLW